MKKAKISSKRRVAAKSGNPRPVLLGAKDVSLDGPSPPEEKPLLPVALVANTSTGFGRAVCQGFRRFAWEQR